jgi:hemerythrin-like domain-containing protein
MLPIGILMREHRVIEKLMPPIRAAVAAGRREGRIDTGFVERAIEFIRHYADRCHHGKEEDILFRALERKPLSGPHREILDELKEEHRMGRQRVRELAEALEAYRRGDDGALAVILDRLDLLASFYPLHIQKEDQNFFFPVMDYLDDRERAAMIDAEREFDRQLLHDLFREKVEAAARLAGIGPSNDRR